MNRLRGISIYEIENIFYKYRVSVEYNCDATPYFLWRIFATQPLNNGAELHDVQEMRGIRVL